MAQREGESERARERGDGERLWSASITGEQLARNIPASAAPGTRLCAMFALAVLAEELMAIQVLSLWRLKEGKRDGERDLIL